MADTTCPCPVAVRNRACHAAADAASHACQVVVVEERHACQVVVVVAHHACHEVVPHHALKREAAEEKSPFHAKFESVVSCRVLHVEDASLRAFQGAGAEEATREFHGGAEDHHLTQMVLRYYSQECANIPEGGIPGGGIIPVIVPPDDVKCIGKTRHLGCHLQEQVVLECFLQNAYSVAVVHFL